tara:strand:- start:1113 stop:1451 length:339 start_codon:yes stop_codon:yes gene_type:complete
MAKIFPKDRIQFCKTADGTNVYHVWRYCGKVIRDCFFSLEPVQSSRDIDKYKDFDVFLLGLPEMLDLDPEDTNVSDEDFFRAVIQSVTDKEIHEVIETEFRRAAAQGCYEFC